MRVKIEDQVKIGTIDHLNDNSASEDVVLLKPIVESGTWRWAPVLPKSNELFELLDRKVPASLLAFTQLSIVSPMVAVASKEAIQVTGIDRLLRSVASLSHISPASALFTQVGSACLDSISKSAKLTGSLGSQFYKN